MVRNALLYGPFLWFLSYLGVKRNFVEFYHTSWNRKSVKQQNGRESVILFTAHIQNELILDFYGCEEFKVLIFKEFMIDISLADWQELRSL